ncbi:MAG TPA: PQQ-binding-like beta-propeller repeat protein [Ideonella sp.]|uniref:PQQ-binding-like beta-propeller repeat protein n=1 Tax=Ideonella sp. TaxID=1929293 RepID=UPI002E2F024A|nr:PQQ-binding-like beta-propeller repeat protein [Ideonella sp.]HEX5682896.1 PQQ-binding-like beta-propeller repeat protein [Ideonella sp.]
MLVAASAAATVQAQWSQDGYDAGKSYANTAESTLTRQNAGQLTQKWQAMIGQFYASSAIQADGRLFVCSNLYGVSAQAPDTGDMLWSQPDAGVGDCGNPALAGSTAYLVSSSFNTPYRNVLTAVDQPSGKVLWTADLPAGSAYLNLGFGPAVQGDRLYVNTGRTAVMAVDTADGRLVWQASTGGGVVLNNDVAVANGRVFTTTWHECCDANPRQLFAFDAATGAALWASDVDTSNMQYPALAQDRRVIVGSDSGVVRAFAAASGKLLWSRTLSGYISSPLVGKGHTVYAASGNRQVQAMDARTGDVLWTRTLSGTHQVASNLAWANGALYMTTQDFNTAKQLLVLSARTGKVTAAVPLSIRGSFTKLTVIDGRVYLSSEGQVTAFGL